MKRVSTGPVRFPSVALEIMSATERADHIHKINNASSWKSRSVIALLLVVDVRLRPNNMLTFPLFTQESHEAWRGSNFFFPCFWAEKIGERSHHRRNGGAQWE